MKRNSDFRPSQRWGCVVGVEGIATTLSLFLKVGSFPVICTNI